MKGFSQVQAGKQDPLAFTKMAGGGNDFVVIDNRAGRVSDPVELARRVTAIGARLRERTSPSD